MDHSEGTKNLANQALVFLVRGIASKWKQPLGYFLANGATAGDKQKVFLMDCLQKLKDVGLIVKGVICDQGSNNRKMYSLLGVTEDKPYVVLNNDDQHQKIYCMYDPPHLLKSVRNNLKKHGFVTDGHEVKWQYIASFFQYDSKLPLRMAPKLTSKHIELPPFSAMRVPLAAQVLSHTVASGILTYTSLGKLPSDAAVYC